MDTADPARVALRASPSALAAVDSLPAVRRNGKQNERADATAALTFSGRCLTLPFLFCLPAYTLIQADAEAPAADAAAVRPARSSKLPRPLADRSSPATPGGSVPFPPDEA